MNELAVEGGEQVRDVTELFVDPVQEGWGGRLIIRTKPPVSVGIVSQLDASCCANNKN